MRHLTALLVLLFLCLNLSANDITIQLAAFNQPVNIYTYFEGVSNVKMMRNGKEFYVYYVDGIKNSTEANQKISEFKRMGFKAMQIDMDAIYACKSTCSKNKKNVQNKLTNSYSPKELQDYEKVRIVLMNDLASTIVLKGNCQRIKCYLNMRGVSNCRMIVKDANTSAPLNVWVYNDTNEVVDVESTFRTLVGLRSS